MTQQRLELSACHRTGRTAGVTVAAAQGDEALEQRRTQRVEDITGQFGSGPHSERRWYIIRSARHDHSGSLEQTWQCATGGISNEDLGRGIAAAPFRNGGPRVPGGRILVVDDDTILRTSVGRVLEDEGYAVDHAGDGQEALVRIAEQRPDAILLDVLMPGMNGRQLLEILQGESGTATIPVVVMTAVRGIDANSAIALGASDLVEKPFDVEDLLNKIALALYRTGHVESRPSLAPAVDAGCSMLDGEPLAAHLSGIDPVTDGMTDDVILVVDDDPQNLSALDRLLTAHGFTVVSLSRATEDLPRLARVLEPRAILLDLRLPGNDGMTALRWLRAEGSLDSVPILVFSGSDVDMADSASEIADLRAALKRKPDAMCTILDFIARPPATARRS